MPCHCLFNRHNFFVLHPMGNEWEKSGCLSHLLHKCSPGSKRSTRSEDCQNTQRPLCGSRLRPPDQTQCTCRGLAIWYVYFVARGPKDPRKIWLWGISGSTDRINNTTYLNQIPNNGNYSATRLCRWIVTNNIRFDYCFFQKTLRIEVYCSGL